MKYPILPAACFARLTCLLSLGVASAGGLAETFTVDDVRSSLVLSGSVLGVDFQAQAAGSLETSYTGTINVTLAATTLTFSGGSVVVADNSGSWEPKAKGVAGSEPANYGATASNPLATAKAAARHVQFDVTSGSIAVTGGNFAAADADFTVPAAAGAVIDYLVTGPIFNKANALTFAGSADNAAATQGSLFTNGDTQTLTLPVDVTYNFKLLTDGDTIVNLKGKLVATRTAGGGAPTNTFDGWAAQFFPGVSDPAIIGPTADPDGDGVLNLSEFAFGLNPNQPDHGFAPLGAKNDPAHPDVLTVEFIRPKGLEGIAYTLRVLQSPDDWKPLNVIPEITDLGDGRERLTFRDIQSITAAVKRFIQLQVTKL